MKHIGKRLLSLLLTAALLCGFMPAAFAADTVPPLYEQMGYESADGFMAGEGFDRVDYDWVCTQHQKELARVKANPEMILEEFPWLDSVEDVYTAWEGGEEEALRWFALTLVYDAHWSYIPPLSVQLGGKTVDFADAQPEMANQRVMVPLRAVIDALDGESSYDLATRTVTVTAKGVTVQMIVGETAYTVSPGETQGEMDAAPYLKDGRTYVPVRFFAEALGLTVQWDEYNRTAVLYDRAALVSALDKRFSVLNQWLAVQPARDPDETLHMVMSIAAAYTELNSIDGNTSYPMNGTLKIVSEGGSAEAEIKLDLYALTKMLADNSGWLDEEGAFTKAVETIADDLKNATFEMICNADENVLFLRCPLLIEALKLAGPESTQAIDKNVWIQVDGALDENLFGFGLSGLTDEWRETAASGRTVGNLLVMQNETGYVEWKNMWESVQWAADDLAGWLGDDQFTRSGQTYTAGFETENEYGDGYEKGEVGFNVATGRVSGKVETRTKGYSDTLATYVFEAGAESGRMTVQLHRKNSYIIDLTMDVRTTTGGASPAKRPPENAKIVNIDEL